MEHYYSKYNDYVANVIKDAYLELNKKYNLEIKGTKAFDKRVIKRLFELDINTKDEYYNYLLSLDNKKYKCFIWHLMIEEFDDQNVFDEAKMIKKYCEYTGKAKSLYLKVFEAFQNYMREDWNVQSINKTEPISNSVIRLSPMAYEDYYSILENNNLLDVICKEIKGNELYYVSGLFTCFNHKSLGFKIERINDNKFVGFIGLKESSLFDGFKEKDGYKIYCYILFSERRKKYATNAIELLLKLFNKDKFLISKEDAVYKYLLQKEKMDIEAIDILLKEGSRYIDKELENMGFKLIDKEYNYGGIEEHYRYTKKED